MADPLPVLASEPVARAGKLQQARTGRDDHPGEAHFGPCLAEASCAPFSNDVQAFAEVSPTHGPSAPLALQQPIRDLTAPTPAKGQQRRRGRR